MWYTILTTLKTYHMTILTDTEKESDKVQQVFMIESPEENRKTLTYLNIIKSIWDKCVEKLY